MPISVITLGEPVRGSSVQVDNTTSSALSAVSAGTGASIFGPIVGGVQTFKSFIASTGIVLTNNTNDLTFAVDTAYINSLVAVGPSGFTANRVMLSSGTGTLIVSTVTTTELSYVSGVTSSIQTQLNGKQALITGAATTIVSSNLSASCALVSDASGKVVISSVTSTELGYLSGVTSLIQTQLNTLSSAIGSTITNPLTSNLVVPNPYKISFNSGALILDLNGLTATGTTYISLVAGNITTTSGYMAAGGGISTSGGAPFMKVKVIAIGNWSMKTSGSPVSTSVTHGLTGSKIRSVSAVIYDDTSSNGLDIMTAANGVVSPLYWGVAGTTINLSSAVGGYFDNASYISAIINRGYITIWYEA